MSSENIARRAFLIAGASALSLPARGAATSPIHAFAFDAFPIFDPGSLTTLAISLIGEKGTAMVAQWSSRLFGYTWYETAAGRYESFRTLAENSLRFTSRIMGVSLSDNAVGALVAQYDTLDAWPDVRPVLQTLRERSIRLALLSNLGLDTLKNNLARNGLAEFFEVPLSTDAIRRFKPSPAAYAMALDAFDLPKTQIGFAAFAGWDATGASGFGYRTAWINRAKAPIDPLGIVPEIESQGLSSALRLAGFA